ncbi:DUF3830 family protein [Bythopirellula goksoeyrii]|uniref:Uncharacterized protein n=1 Tax=Bythopirellula goksoeyrii TaxID=1400387 RepID=A0A5B9Q7Z9_9BACT|nr:DUF3830 family protein [Bythopirellula goksoeyrii]QEG35147.1 hypothetical protein Pr1d_24380 [Bythopirellula goksoeyrii]
MNQPAALLFTFFEEQAAARANLLWEVAPKTCSEVCNVLPSVGKSHHGIYSGSECVQILETLIRVDPENATSSVSKGQVGFTWMAAGSVYGVEEDFAEICWFYDIDAEPRMWGGPFEVNIFAEFSSDADDFFAVCRRMRREGVKPLRIEKVDD